MVEKKRTISQNLNFMLLFLGIHLLYQLNFYLLNKLLDNRN